jgi:rsbT co-antagonist protein RsbR
MAMELTGVPEFTAEEQSELREFWEFYSARRAELAKGALEALARIPELAAAMGAIPAEQRKADEAANLEGQRAALVEGKWGPHLERLKAQGTTYAKAGLSFGAWFHVLRIFREGIHAALLEDGQPADGAMRLVRAMDRWLDVSMKAIGQAYLDTKEQTISQQQTAIRELSTPVLQVRDRQLIIPIIGLVDTQRARHLTQALLGAIRQRRARLVVMDITGVPVVDSKVANHLVQACEAARLMGTKVILSGVSPEIAQALVMLGADLPGVSTVVDLQTALEDGDRWLASGAPMESADDSRTGVEVSP